MSSQESLSENMLYHVCAWCDDGSLCTGFYTPYDGACLCTYVDNDETLCCSACFDQYSDYKREEEYIRALVGEETDSESSSCDTSSLEDYEPWGNENSGETWVWEGVREGNVRDVRERLTGSVRSFFVEDKENENGQSEHTQR